MKQNLKTFFFTALLSLAVGSAWADDHYVNGDGTIGWQSGNEYNLSPVAMVRVKENVWVWAGHVNADQRFRFTGLNWGGHWATSDNDILGSEEKQLKNTQDGGDFAFKVQEGGFYRITADFTNLKVKAEKLAEPSKDGDYYLIATVDDYYWFAGKVTSEESSTAKARLTADLDFSEKGFFPLACDKYKFKGEFDGGGHTISHAETTVDNNNIGFVRFATGGTNIHDVVIEGSFTGNAKVGGIIGFARDGGGTVTLTNVINKATVRSTGSVDANAAGLFGCATDGVKIVALNCANMGAVSGQNGQCAAFAGWTQTGTTFTNCWNSGEISNIDGTSQLYRNSGAVTATNCYDLTSIGGQGSKLDALLLNTADFCFKLNNNISGATDWYLTIGTDAHPYPFAGDAAHGTIYANGLLYCDGVLKPGTILENEEKESVRDAHNFNERGFCSNSHDDIVCNELQSDFMTPDGNGYYLIGTKEQLNWFAYKVNGYKSVAASYDINGKLTADIDFSKETAMIGGDGNSVAYRGTFDGQGHKVTLGYAANAHNAALFRTISSANIKNLVTDGIISNEGSNCAGGIFGGSHGASVVENCVSYVTLSRTAGGDATFGGIGAYMHDNGKIKNCAFYGSITTPDASGNGGLLGYANGGNNIAVENCVVNAVSFTFSGNSVSVARNTGNVNNTYVVNAGNATQNEQIAATAEQLVSGELAYKLNSEVSGGTNWYQIIGTDAAPLPIAKVGATVYTRGSLNCDGTPKPDFTYVNEESEPSRDSHAFGEGNINAFCSVCDNYNPGYAITKDGSVFLIDDATELKWFAAMVNAEGGNKDARLTADIDFAGVENYPGIGTETNKYTGTFDGQKYKISNLTMNYDQQGVGVVNRAGVGVVIKNLLVDNTCSFTGKEGVAAFIGAVYGNGGTVLVENCGNEAVVNATSKNAGALVGCNYANDQNRLSIINSYNTGAINSTAEGGAFSGWVHKGAKVINCYNTGSLSGCEGFIRGYDQTITNCYSTNNTSSGTYGRSANESTDNMEDGKLFAVLYAYNDGDVDGAVWRMGDDHPVLYGNQIAMSENGTNRIVEGFFDVKLYRTIKTDVWNTFVVPFDLSNAELEAAFGDDVQVAEYSETAIEDESTVSFVKMAIPAITANVPVLLKSANTGVFSFAGRTIEAAEVKAEGMGNFDFVGSYNQETVVEEGDYYLSNNAIYKSMGNGSTISATRAYIKTKDGANARIAAFFIEDDGQTTGVASVKSKKTENTGLYTLSGQRVDNAQVRKGLYIRDGRKMVVK